MWELEAVIERGLTTFVDVGAALLEIRDRRLYRESHGAFEDYCQDRWGFNRHRASQLISAARIAGELVTNVTTPIQNEAQARELSRVEPERRPQVWEVVVEQYPELEGRSRREALATAKLLDGLPEKRQKAVRAMVASHDGSMLATLTRVSVILTIVTYAVNCGPRPI